MATVTYSGEGRGGVNYEKLETLLAQQDALLWTRRQALRQRAATEMTDVKDSEERSADAEESGVGFTLLELDSQMMREMETALGRIKSGTYGRCDDCDGRIASGRLRAISFAKRCKECQQRAEGESMQDGSWRSHSRQV
jgi:DnaK suppressor protein